MQKKWKRLVSSSHCVFIHEFAHCPAGRGQLGELLHPSGGNPSALAHCPCHIQAGCRAVPAKPRGVTFTSPAAESCWGELPLPHRGHGAAVTAALWKDKRKMELFKHPVLWLLLILGQGGGGGSLLELGYRVSYVPCTHR